MGWVLVVSLFVCAGQLCQKQAVEHWRGRDLPWLHKLLSVWLLAAMGLLGLGMVFWLLALQTLPVSIAYPMLSLNFVWVSLASHYIYREQSDGLHWLGIGLIIAGIACLGPQL